MRCCDSREERRHTMAPCLFPGLVAWEAPRWRARFFFCSFCSCWMLGQVSFNDTFFLKAQNLSWAVIPPNWCISNFGSVLLTCSLIFKLTFQNSTLHRLLIIGFSQSNSRLFFKWTSPVAWIVSSHSEMYSRNKQFSLTSHTCLWLTAKFCNSRHFVTAAWTRFHDL